MVPSEEGIESVPTTYPKTGPSEMMGFLVLVKDHGGDEELARLAADLDLELDEILPASDFAEALGLLIVHDGRAALTETGRKLLAGSIRDRKNILREQLRRTTLYRAILRALENAPEGRLTEDELNRLIEFTSAPVEEFVQVIITWGRFTELFRYDPSERVLLPAKPRAAGRSPPPGRPGPPGVGRRADPAEISKTASSEPPHDSAAGLAHARG